jgi:hypothetical protein
MAKLPEIGVKQAETGSYFTGKEDICLKNQEVVNKSEAANYSAYG